MYRLQCERQGVNASAITLRLRLESLKTSFYPSAGFMAPQADLTIPEEISFWSIRTIWCRIFL